MLLAVDIGNTNTKLALCAGPDLTIKESWRVASIRERMPDEWFTLVASLLRASGYRTEDVTAVAVSSVVPAITTWFSVCTRDRFRMEPLVVSYALDLGIVVATEHPAETGVDRIVNAAAAFAKYGGPVVIVDCGTATKFDVVDAGGRFLGGAIAPGLALSLDALAGRAARLYAVDLVPPAVAIGRDTVTGLQSGVVLGYLSLCDGMLQRIQAELGSPAQVVLTGGAGTLVAPHIATAHAYEPRLTIDGIRLAFARNAAATNALGPTASRVATD